MRQDSWPRVEAGKVVRMDHTHLYVFAKNIKSSTSIVRRTVLPFLCFVSSTESVFVLSRPPFAGPYKSSSWTSCLARTR